MEFKFRAVDDRLPTRLHPPSIISYFSEPAFTDRGPMRNPGDAREAIQWELEKERVREEIILAEIARRRVLEAEVRAELMIEREMAMRRLDAKAHPMILPFEERLTMRSDSRVPPLMLPFDEFTFPGSGGGFNALPLRRRLPEAMPLDIKRPWEIHEDKAKRDPSISGTKRKAVTPPAGSTSELPAFGLRKRPKDEWSCALCHVSAPSERVLNEHLQGKKHKAKEAGLRAQKMGKIVISTPLLKGSNKCSKPTDTPKIGFSGLVEAQVEGEARQENKTGDGSGKKMKGSNMCSKPTDTPKIAFSGLGEAQVEGEPRQENKTGDDSGKKMKGSNKCSKPTDTPKIVFSGLVESQVEGEPRQENKTGDDSGKKMKITEDLKNEDEQVLLHKNRNAEDSKKTNDMAKELEAEKITAPQKMKKFKFWCEMCQVGAYSPVVMEGHKKGKKHRARLQGLGEQDEFDGSASVMALAPAITLKEVGTDLAAKKANKSATQKPKIKI